jgi:hypothetical protein
MYAILSLTISFYLLSFHCAAAYKKPAFVLDSLHLVFLMAKHV